ncbi:MAG: DNA replication and repair protein RecF, partial [Acidimicrobiia bacterium]|nr:DNA replication and repair protein RecF [Acidimicrobiia bacterium]
RQKLSRGRDLVGTVLVSVFAPDDLVLVKGGPSNRRAFVDDLVVGRHRSNDRDRNELDKVLRQRNALLKQCRGRLDGAAAATLDVWDTKFAELGDRWADLRSDALAAIRPAVADAHRDLSAGAADVTVAYEPVWRGSGLAAALEASRETDLRRGVTTIGPHRDEIDIGLAGMPSRTHASQGEQRTLALSLRLAAHRHLAEVHDSSPILLLDDVFSELDPSRSAALLASLPAGQVFVSTAGPLPVDAAPDQHIDLAVRRAV